MSKVCKIASISGADIETDSDFPRRPTDALKQHITEEADSRLAYYLPLPPDPNPIPGFEPPPRPQLPPGTVDTPLVRLFNFLRMLLFSCLAVDKSSLFPTQF